MCNSIIILNVIPQPGTNKEWFVQWVAGGIRHERYYEYFEELSRFVEGHLLT